MTVALQKAEDLIFTLREEFNFIRKLEPDTSDKSVLENEDFEKDETSLLKEQEIKELKKEYVSAKTSWKQERESLTNELDHSKILCESSKLDFSNKLSSFDDSKVVLEEQVAALKEDKVELERQVVALKENVLKSRSGLVH